MREVQCQQSRGVRVVAWFCETPPLLSICPHPARLIAPPPPPRGGEGSRGDTRGGPYHQTLGRGRYTPVGVGQTGMEQKAPSPVSGINMPPLRPLPGQSGLTRNYKGREEEKTPLRISEDKMTTSSRALPKISVGGIPIRPCRPRARGLDGSQVPGSV